MQRKRHSLIQFVQEAFFLSLVQTTFNNKNKEKTLRKETKRIIKTEHTLSSSSGRKKEICENKLHINHEKLPIE